MEILSPPNYADAAPYAKTGKTSEFLGFQSGA
jgi:hypothetical protein